jgi:hypothetical protein
VRALVLACGPSRVRVCTNCDRMFDAFSSDTFTAAMLPLLKVEPDGPADYAVEVILGERNELYRDSHFARLAFRVSKPRDHKEAYFESLFLIQAWLAHTLLNRHGLLMMKAGAVVLPRGAVLIVGGAGMGKSNVIEAILERGQVPFVDGKAIVSEQWELVGGASGLAPRRDGFDKKRLEGATRPIAGREPVVAAIFPVVQPYARAGTLEVRALDAGRAAGRMFEAASHYSCAVHYHLPLLKSPLPQLDNRRLHERRHAFAMDWGERPAWLCRGTSQAIAELIWATFGG